MIQLSFEEEPFDMKTILIKVNLENKLNKPQSNFSLEQMLFKKKYKTTALKQFFKKEVKNPAKKTFNVQFWANMCMFNTLITINSNRDEHFNYIIQMQIKSQCLHMRDQTRGRTKMKQLTLT